MRLILAGTNYKVSPLEAREAFSFTKEDALNALSLAVESGVISGGVLLSTCQRVELYAEAGDIRRVVRFLIDFKELKHGIAKYLYVKNGYDAARHLFMVTSGLNSQVVGEGEIIRQVREAYIDAKKLAVTTPLLNRLFERALFTGKLVRSSTDINKADNSVASLAVDFTDKRAGIAGKKVFIIGSGIVAKNVALSCHAKGAGCILVANRTYERAQDIAREAGGKAVRFDDFYKLLGEADIIFSATKSRHLILKKELFDKKRRPGKRILIFDLAFPRDVDPDIAGLEDVKLFNLDDLNVDSVIRTGEIAKAMNIVSEKVDRFTEKEDFIWRSGSVHGQALLR